MWNCFTTICCKFRVEKSRCDLDLDFFPLHINVPQYVTMSYMYYVAKTAKVLQHVKISLYNQPKPYFFQKLLWSHFWIDFNKFYTKTFSIVYILIVYLLIMFISPRFLCRPTALYIFARAVGRQRAMHTENSGFASPTLGQHISTFRGYRSLFSIRNPYINRFTNHFSIHS